MSALSADAKKLLTLAAAINGWYLDENEENIIACADLLKRKWVSVQTDYSGLLVYATSEGEKAAKHLGFVRDGTRADRSRIVRTEIGFELTK